MRISSPCLKARWRLNRVKSNCVVLFLVLHLVFACFSNIFPRKFCRLCLVLRRGKSCRPRVRPSHVKALLTSDCPLSKAGRGCFLGVHNADVIWSNFLTFNLSLSLARLFCCFYLLQYGRSRLRKSWIWTHSAIFIAKCLGLWTVLFVWPEFSAHEPPHCRCWLTPFRS
jgi:hypothetical protein